MSETTETTGAPPKGYFRCPKQCGRWTAWAHDEKDLVRCNHCTAKDDAAVLANMESACGPDWMPPIAQPPAAAHVGIDMAAPGSEHTAHRCTGCDWFIDTTCMADTQIAELVGAHMRRDHGSAHVERRAGQRYRRPGGRVVTLIKAVKHGWVYVPSDPGGVDVVGNEWMDSNWLLLADAPPEPAKPTTPQCESFCRPGLRCKFCTTEVATESPPAQEAPKAAPAFAHDFSDPYCAMKFNGKTRPRCNACGEWQEDARPSVACTLVPGWRAAWEAEGCPKPTGILRDPAIGERLARPQLAADWVEDCLEDVR